MKLTTATEEQQSSVASMIDKMLKPTRAPDGMSFTMGWDVVASYSETHINNLLATRHTKSQGKMLRNMELNVPYKDKRTRKTYNTKYSLKFGPPLIQFNSQAISGPSCSLTMAILEGTEQTGDDGEVLDVEKGYSLTLAGIPLGSVQGGMVDGQVQNASPIIPGHKTIHFDYDTDEQRHVVLDFVVNKDLQVVVSGPTDQDAADSAYNEGEFQRIFKQYFANPDNGTALSYSIASINNTSPKHGSRDLEPVSFQFASYVSPKPRDDGSGQVLSIMIGVRGGDKTGVVERLQARWQTQWLDNDIGPIPAGFTASLILSASTIYKTLLAPGFQGDNWTTKNISDANGTGIKLEARYDGTFSSPHQAIKYSSKSVLKIRSFSISMKDWPMKLELKQDSGRGGIKAYVYWYMDTTVSWVDEGKFLNIDFMDTEWGSSTVKLIYRLCDANDHSKPRQLPCTASMTDAEFNLNIDLAGDVWRMDQQANKEEWYDMSANAGAWEKGAQKLWALKPDAKVKSIGLGFLRTTNLLTPDAEVIDFNEAIGLKAPRDFVLVGDVLPE